MSDADTLKVLHFLVERDVWVDKFYMDDEGQIVIAENCNDLFFWACADYEDITPEDLPAYDKALKDCEAIGVGFPAYAGTVWACRKRGMRPQNPCYASYPKEIWPLLDAAGPERDEKTAGSRARAEQRYAENHAPKKPCETCKGTGKITA